MTLQLRRLSLKFLVLALSINDTRHKTIECRYTECNYAECCIFKFNVDCCYSESHYTECHCAKYHYAKCHYGHVILVCVIGHVDCQIKGNKLHNVAAIFLTR
jgi:hypothetical protein